MGRRSFLAAPTITRGVATFFRSWDARARFKRQHSSCESSSGRLKMPCGSGYVFENEFFSWARAHRKIFFRSAVSDGRRIVYFSAESHLYVQSLFMLETVTRRNLQGHPRGRACV